jgi:hypothetical protein
MQAPVATARTKITIAAKAADILTGVTITAMAATRKMTAAACLTLHAAITSATVVTRKTDGNGYLRKILHKSALLWKSAFLFIAFLPAALS